MKLCSVLIAFIAVLSGCGTEDGSSVRHPYAIAAFDLKPGDGAGFGGEQFPEIVLGPPQGGGDETGSLDVLSLGTGGELKLQFAHAVYDGAGPDFIIYENPFRYGDRVFAEPAEIAVSNDGVEWTTFDCDPDAPSPNGCAGYEVVQPCASGESAQDEVDAQCGGDHFDLATIGIDRIQYLRIRDLSTTSGTSNNAGFDLDAAAAIHLVDE